VKAKFKSDYNDRVKKGTVVTVENLKQSSDCLTGLLVLVSGPWKRPMWFDLSWFTIIRRPKATP
jgi:hypothetical protein